MNRDLRCHMIKIPGERYWGWGTTSGGGADYEIPRDSMGDFQGPDGVAESIGTYSPGINNPDLGRNIGYQNRKFITEHVNRETREESYNVPLIRLAEVMLTYAEATCELGNGSISDADLDLSINKIRERSGAAPR